MQTLFFSAKYGALPYQPNNFKANQTHFSALPSMPQAADQFSATRTKLVSQAVKQSTPHFGMAFSRDGKLKYLLNTLQLPGDRQETLQKLLNLVNTSAEGVRTPMLITILAYGNEKKIPFKEMGLAYDALVRPLDQPETSKERLHEIARGLEKAKVTLKPEDEQKLTNRLLELLKQGGEPAGEAQISLCEIAKTKTVVARVPYLFNVLEKATEEGIPEERTHALYALLIAPFNDEELMKTHPERYDALLHLTVQTLDISPVELDPEHEDLLLRRLQAQPVETPRMVYTQALYQSDNAEECRVLVQHAGANINASMAGGSTALHNATLQGDLEKFLILLELGANRKALTENGDTILHKAIRSGNLDVVKAVLAIEPDLLKASNKANQSPLQTAQEFKRPEIADYLKRMGAK